VRKHSVAHWPHSMQAARVCSPLPLFISEVNIEIVCSVSEGISYSVMSFISWQTGKIVF
jgi:hypothetical protein